MGAGGEAYDRCVGEDALRELERFHREVDAAAEELAEVHGDRLRCRKGCSQCCVDGLTVLTVEADLIRRRHARVLEQEDPYPLGACAFLSPSGACRIYAHRPYVCRTQGLPLAWLEETGAGQLAELRDICPLNEPGGPPVEDLPGDECWRIGPWEGRLARIQYRHANRLERIALRDLFRDPWKDQVLPCSE